MTMTKDPRDPHFTARRRAGSAAWALAAATMLVLSACSDDGPGYVPDCCVDQEHDSTGTAWDRGFAPDVDPAQIPCDQVAGAFRALLAMPGARSCSTVADCVMVSDFHYYSSCGCYPLLTGSGEGVNAAYARHAEQLLRRLHTPPCRSQAGKLVQNVCDAAPATDLRCEGGTCAVTPQGCMPVPDMGAPGG